MEGVGEDERAYNYICNLDKVNLGGPGWFNDVFKVPCYISWLKWRLGGGMSRTNISRLTGVSTVICIALDSAAHSSGCLSWAWTTFERSSHSWSSRRFEGAAFLWDSSTVVGRHLCRA